MGSRLRKAAFLIAAALLLGGCTAEGSKSEAPAAPAAPGAAVRQEEMPLEEKDMKAEYHKLAQADAKARMDSGDALVILDVRTKAEFDAGHIAGAVLLPNEDIGEEAPPELPDKEAEILIYCRSGNRSAQAAKKLVAMGYTNVYDFGGINTWAYGVVTD